MRRRSAALLCWLACLVAHAGCGLGERQDVLIIAVEGDPTSIALAVAWAETRDISVARILRLPLSERAQALEIDEETYLNEIAAPVEAHLALTDPDREIHILVTTPGLPLRIGHCDVHAVAYPRSCRSAAVDAALAQLGRTGDPTRAFLRGPNPFFRSPLDHARFVESNPDSPLRFLVARLTAAGATTAEGDETAPEIFTRLLERVAANPEEAARTWTVLGTDATRSPGAEWLLKPAEDRLAYDGHVLCRACDRPASAGAPAGAIQVAFEDERGPTEEALPNALGYPGVVLGLAGVLDARDARGQKAQREAWNAFVSKWLDRGANAISTHVSDPTLAGVTRPAEFLDAMVHGRNALEAHFASTPQLGWTHVYLGDPFLAIPPPEDNAANDRDRDHDGISDELDNCLSHANPAQRDTNGDGHGNRCDADFDGDGLVSTSWGTIYPLDARGDLESITLTVRNGPYDPDLDLDGDGQVDEDDAIITQLALFGPPGPSAPRAEEGFGLFRFLGRLFSGESDVPSDVPSDAPSDTP